MSKDLRIGEAAEFRMYARQLRIFRAEQPVEELHKTLDFLKETHDFFDERYIELFKMCCDLDFVEALGSAGVSYCHDRDNT